MPWVATIYMKHRAGTAVGAGLLCLVVAAGTLVAGRYVMAT
jgi:hypothetical protein